MHISPTVQSTPDIVVAKAMLRAAERLGVGNNILEKVIGVSDSTLRRIRKSGKMPADQKKMELALLFIRLFRSLDAIAGGDAKTAGSWMHAENSALRARPVELIQTVTGLVDVLGYLDSRRAIV